MKVLFVCSRNKWRSRTAETIFKDSATLQVQSAGTAASARIRLTDKQLLWADLIFVMENKHRQHISQKFPHAFDADKIIVLDIPDEYPYMDEELIAMLQTTVSPYLED